ncbi:spermidine/putrescine ABC transporter permease [Streptomyces antimycoticus]|uniref:Spermidine/putrescine ABC transporter permease n=1 Tax=Streptomyces antimycoticus TaxID=68175 RepID=A0A499V0P2_9ACTN|nr:ABC transporter permease [Streptomyces antimycoticus]BBJ45918.1 spermidine/putrescine ABC transporter permease [Streptomyces antimycoticus]
MRISRTARVVLGCITAAGLAIVYVPLLLVLLNSVNTDRSFGWPPSGLTGRWWRAALHSEGARQALFTSLKAGLAATGIALVLGTLAAYAVHRHRFFGRRTVSFLLVLPIALPGIVSGIALNAAFRTVLDPIGIGFGLFTVVVGHATFCVVIVFNNIGARLRRIAPSLAEASADLGARPWQTFRYVTYPAMRSALFAGGLLAFALSFDEIVVTTFTAGPGTRTLPIWIYENLARPHQAPVVNVVAALLILASVIPVYIAQRLSSDTAGGRL